jgi:hypothetical protein
MKRSPSIATVLPMLFAVGTLTAACGDPSAPGGDPPVVAIIVASPIDTLLAVGSGTGLTATATDAAGDTVTTAFDWTSSDPAVAVNSAGHVEAVSPGVATITATADGVSGTIRLRVVPADLTAIRALLADPYAAALVAAVVDNQTVAEAWADAGDAAANGNLVALAKALGTLTSEAGAATGHDRAVLGALDLFTDHLLTLCACNTEDPS